MNINIEVALKGMNLLPIGTKLEFGDWDYGWRSYGTIVGYTPSGRFYRVQIEGAKSVSRYTVKEIHEGRTMTYKGYCPIKIV